MGTQLESVGLWVSLLLALFTFSALVQDNYLSRLAQHIFVGASLGYLAVLVIQHVLRPRLVVPLVQSGGGDIWVTVPAILGLLLLVASIDRAFSQGRSADRPVPVSRRLLHGLGMCAVAILLGVGISTGVIGAIQGTLMPQFGQVASFGLSQGASWGQIGTMILTLLITTGVLLHLYVEPALIARKAAPARQDDPARQLVMQNSLAVWSWLGKRALWFGSGILFARLVLSHISFVGAQIDAVAHMLEQTPFWRIIVTLGQRAGF